MNLDQLIDVFEQEGQLLDATLRRHPRLYRFFAHDFADANRATLAEAYARLLKLKADYVAFTVPALRAAGEALRDGDDEDRRWSALFLGYADGETDHDGDQGHHYWALADMKAIGAPSQIIDAPRAASATLYGRYFVDEARHHPYAILGAKGVLEHFSIRVSDDLVAGVLASKIPGAENGVSFFREHGVLDIDHVRQGDRNLGRLTSERKRADVLQGAFFTSGAYRALVREALPT